MANGEPFRQLSLTGFRSDLIRILNHTLIRVLAELSPSMADHSSPLEGEEVSLLQVTDEFSCVYLQLFWHFHIEKTALATAFNPPPTFPLSQPEVLPQAVELTKTPPPPAVDASLPSSSDDESWKSEYESHVQSWRAQSAEAREKAEKERARWEEVRALEKEQGWSGTTNSEVDSGDPAVPEPSPVDVRDLITGEQEVKNSYRVSYMCLISFLLQGQIVGAYSPWHRWRKQNIVSKMVRHSIGPNIVLPIPLFPICFTSCFSNTLPSSSQAYNYAS